MQRRTIPQRLQDLMRALGFWDEAKHNSESISELLTSVRQTFLTGEEPHVEALRTLTNRMSASTQVGGDEREISAKLDSAVLWHIVSALMAPEESGKHIKQHWVSVAYLRNFAESPKSTRNNMKICSYCFANNESYQKTWVDAHLFCHGQSYDGHGFYSPELENFYSRIEASFGAAVSTKRKRTTNRHTLLLLLMSLHARAPHNSEMNFSGGIRTLEDFVSFYENFRTNFPKVFVQLNVVENMCFNANEPFRAYDDPKLNQRAFYAPLRDDTLLIVGAEDVAQISQKIFRRAQNAYLSNARRNSGTVFGLLPKMALKK